MDFAACATAFGLIFLLELPDKTAYTVLVLSTRNRPLPVFLGSAAAFVVQSALGVLLGTVLNRLPHAVVQWGTVAILVGFALHLLLAKGEVHPDAPPARPGHVFLTSFGLVFLAELGDATQLATAALVARSGQKLATFIGATLALWAVGGVAVTVGRVLGDRIPQALLRRTAGTLFLAMALYVALMHS